MSKIIFHVNRQKIDSNRKHKRNVAVIARKYKGNNDYAHCFELANADTGEVFGKIIHNPAKPLSCGARVWIELNDDKVKTTKRKVVS